MLRIGSRAFIRRISGQSIPGVPWYQINAIKSVSMCNIHIKRSFGTEKMNEPKKPETYKEYTYYAAIHRAVGNYQEDLTRFNQDLVKIFKELERKNYSMQKIKYVSGLFAVFLAFLSWRTIKSFIGEQTSDVAVLTINDEQVQQSIYEALLKLAEKAKEDPEIQAQLADLLRSSLDVAMKDEETMKILSEMAAKSSNQKRSWMQRTI
jgi:hypothetical protein